MKPATIWKFPFRIDDVVGLEMPEKSHILHVECQHGMPCVWALVIPESTKMLRTFCLIGTGHPITAALGKHVGTFQQGPFVWHMFEEAA